jgi:hypothetical protein
MQYKQTSVDHSIHSTLDNGAEHREIFGQGFMVRIF